MNIKNIIIAIITISTFLFSESIQFAHAQPITVNQGDYVKTRITPPKPNLLNLEDYHIHCTIGYVNVENRTATYAGHCADGTVGSPVYNVHGQKIGNVSYTKYPTLGLLKYVNFLVPITTPVDYAIVKIDNNVKIGNNSYSGNNKTNYSSIKNGDTICSYGATRNKETCGNIVYKSNIFKVIVTNENSNMNGDSGGPSWIPGKGFVGTLSSYFGKMFAFYVVS